MYLNEDLDPKVKTFKCCLCGKESIGYGNNAMPVKKGRCCDDCNMTYVIPFRFITLNAQPNDVEAVADKLNISDIKTLNDLLGKVQ